MTDHRPILIRPRWQPARRSVLAKKSFRSGLPLALLLAMKPCYAAEVNAPLEPEIGGAHAPATRLWYWDPIRDFVVDTGEDTGHILTAPVRMDSRDWLITGAVGAAIIGTAVALDDPVQRFSNRHPSRFADHLAKGAEPFGAAYSFAVIGAFGVGGLALEDEHGKAVFWDSLEATVIASGLITPTLKFVVGRSRPNKEQGSRHLRPFSSGASFPSGHATQAFAVASVIATVYDESPWVTPLALTGAGLVGFARIRGNNHWLSDVIAGGVIGSGVGYTVVHANRGRRVGMQLAIAPLLSSDGQGVSVTWDF